MESSNNKPLESIDLCEPQHCDVTFLVEGRLVRFSRFLLEFHSPVFTAIFSQRWSESKDPSEPIESEMKYCDMSVLFKVLTPYGFRSITFGNVKRLLELGDFYQIGVVASHCERFLLGNVSRDRFMLLCELAATFDLTELLQLVNQEYTLNRCCSYATQAEYLEFLVLCAKATPNLSAVFACVEKKLACYYASFDEPSEALDLLVAGYECGSQVLIDKGMPMVAKRSSLAQLQAAKAKLSVGLHCELMLQYHDCVQSKKSNSEARSEPKPIECFVLARK